MDDFLDIGQIASGLGLDDTAFMIGLSAAVTLFGVWRSLATNRKIAKERAALDRQMAANRATLQLILEYNIYNVEWRRSLMASRDLFRKSEEELDQFFDHPDTPDKLDKLQKAQLVLNTFEVAALGIHKKILDEDLYRIWFRDIVVLKWESVRLYVTKLRQNTGVESLCEEFEKLAKEWDGKKEG